MTDAELDALKAAAKAATPGPWKHYVDQGCNGVLASGKVILPTLHISPENCAYIAAANPAVVLELIAELRQARAERDWVIKQIIGYGVRCPSQETWKRCNEQGKTRLCDKCWLAAAKERG